MRQWTRTFFNDPLLHSAATTQAACDHEAFSLAVEMEMLELTDLDKSAVEALSKAKKRFKDSRRKAT